MKATVTDLKAEADKLQGNLDKKDGEITGMQSYIENELGMVKKRCAAEGIRQPSARGCNHRH